MSATEFTRDRRNWLQSAPLAGLAPAAWARGSGDANRLLTFIGPYAPGGNADLRSRQIGRFIAEKLKLTVVVEIKAGADGNMGTDQIAKAKPDGRVVGTGNFAPLGVNAAMFEKMPFDPAKDLTPICLIERGALATNDLLGDQVDMMFEQMYSAAPNIRAGKVRPLAITSKVRSPLFPEVPTMQEAGLPDAVVERVNPVCNAALNDPTIRGELLAQGNEIGGGTAKQFAALIQSEAARWGSIIKKGKIRAA